MTRFRSLGVAIAVLVLSATAVAAFTLPNLPDGASNGLDTASDMAGKDLPARPTEVPPGDVDLNVDAAAPQADLPDAAGHGADVSSVATSDDPTPDTNKGADVSAAAKDNHGQETAADHRPADAGQPEDAGAPDGAGQPDGAGKPADPGQPADPGAPDGAGKPEGVPAHP